MTQPRLVHALVWALLLSASVQGQSIQSLTESNEALVIRHVNPRTGFATFASSPGKGLLLPLPDNAPASARAAHFIDVYGKAFGLANAAHMKVTRASSADELGVEHVRLQQTHKGVPVRAADFIVHLKGSRVVAANGHALAGLPDDVTPKIASGAARAVAQQLVARQHPDALESVHYSEPSLEILNRELLSDVGEHDSHLAWFVEATAFAMREFIWVDAQTGKLLFHFSQLTDAKSRTVYTASHTGSLPGTLVRNEGGAATGDADQDNAYAYAGATYDYYFNTHARDSFNNAGAAIVSTAHYCPGTCSTPYKNAFWNGAQMVYGDGYASADDVVGHELTHAVTEYSANLFYYQQSGALNESFSDIFGETIDLLDGLGTDTAAVRWKLGEDLPLGAIRNMMTPTANSDPGKISDYQYFVCSQSAWVDNSDGGGVHTNSGVPNHAYALMADGGTYNGRTVTGIGLTKAAKIEYRALTAYLSSGSGFLDDYHALNQSCTDLVGTDGITAGDCTQVDLALLAVEMNFPWPCLDYYRPPVTMCLDGGLPSYVTFDGFETGFGNWQSGQWTRVKDFAKRGAYSAYGSDPDFVSDNKLPTPAGIAIPANAWMYFDHAFEFEWEITTGGGYDGGVLEYSTNNGGSWNDAGALIVLGQLYNGPIYSQFGNPLGGRGAFIRSSYGYTASLVDLSTLAGQTAKFRFRTGSDEIFDSLGWFVDDVAIYTCVPDTFTDNPLVADATPAKREHLLELRAHIDAARIKRGLEPYGWANRALPSGSPIRGTYIVDLRLALADVYTAAGRPIPSYTDPVITSNTNLRAVHITELRSAVVGIE